MSFIALIVLPEDIALWSYLRGPLLGSVNRQMHKKRTSLLVEGTVRLPIRADPG